MVLGCGVKDRVVDESVRYKAVSTKAARTENAMQDQTQSDDIRGGGAAQDGQKR